ncbi:MAG: CAP domain-containing protein [Lachnospiraceae bacterium]|nr:CAP domain-containing protein [Lachnospiraceae bacterium]
MRKQIILVNLNDCRRQEFSLTAYTAAKDYKSAVNFFREYRIWIVLAVVWICAAYFGGCRIVSAKTYSVTLDLTGSGEAAKRPSVMDNTKKVRISNSKRSVVKVKYVKTKRDRRIQFIGKKVGNSTVKVKCYLKNGKTRTYKYKVKVKRSKKKTELDLAKEAFAIQNRYRSEKGVAAIEWSDELYQFCLYRLDTSGFDGHKNILRDMNDYFGYYAGYKKLLFGENLYSGSNLPKRVMECWKKSPRHYANLMRSEIQCGAVACRNGIWCAIFYEGRKEELVGWQDHKIKAVTVKRYDSNSGIYLSDSAIGCYEAGNREATQNAAQITKASGKVIYLEVGKTYVIYERIAPDGYDRAESITLTVAEDTGSEVVLK